MAEPSAPWTDIPDEDIASDELIDFVLLSEIRDNLIWLKEVLGGSYSQEKDHSHNGVNSKSISGFQLLIKDSESLTNGSTWVGVDTVMIYIPSDLTTLTYKAMMACAVDGQPQMRLKKGTTEGTTITGAAVTAYEWAAGEGTIDVSDLSGWQEFTVQLQRSGGSDYVGVTRIMGRLT